MIHKTFFLFVAIFGTRVSSALSKVDLSVTCSFDSCDMTVTGSDSAAVEYKFSYKQWVVETGSFGKNRNIGGWTSDTSATVTPLNADTRYLFSIMSRDTNGVKSKRTWRPAETLPVPPTVTDVGDLPKKVPSPMIVSLESATSFTLTWGPAVGATSYKIALRTGDGPWKTQDASFVGTMYEFTGLSTGVEYTARVRSINDAGFSDWQYAESRVVLVEPPTPLIQDDCGTLAVGGSCAFRMSRNDDHFTPFIFPSGDIYYEYYLTDFVTLDLPGDPKCYSLFLYIPDFVQPTYSESFDLNYRLFDGRGVSTFWSGSFSELNKDTTEFFPNIPLEVFFCVGSAMALPPTVKLFMRDEKTNTPANTFPVGFEVFAQLREMPLIPNANVAPSMDTGTLYSTNLEYHTVSSFATDFATGITRSPDGVGRTFSFFVGDPREISGYKCAYTFNEAVNVIILSRLFYLISSLNISTASPVDGSDMSYEVTYNFSGGNSYVTRALIIFVTFDIDNLGLTESTFESLLDGLTLDIACEIYFPE